ncbi:hypothetical protein HaLaN_22748 [Haematococcus lacustris]|uniref:Uncharacterized protein n=1 Tax=Haematococcus lacustris TaxID=44745 RepID=A0A6A0A1B2_HAELA|nr:hypothetical protein HaLaN_22748 [Haematococcus lacustris]
MSEVEAGVPSAKAPRGTSSVNGGPVMQVVDVISASNLERNGSLVHSERSHPGAHRLISVIDLPGGWPPTCDVFWSLAGYTCDCYRQPGLSAAEFRILTGHRNFSGCTRYSIQ